MKRKTIVHKGVSNVKWGAPKKVHYSADFKPNNSGKKDYSNLLIGIGIAVLVGLSLLFL